MSKENFSQKVSELMQKKIFALIVKDPKVKNRMDRLSYMVDLTEIDKVFTPGFSKEMPVIKYARENNNLWILDNIRDSIMHGSFDIDEERKCFLLNNTQHDRELIAEVPFSWWDWWDLSGLPSCSWHQ